MDNTELTDRIFSEHGLGDNIRPVTVEERRRQLKALDIPDTLINKKLAEEQKASSEIAAHMAPPGGIPGLPPLLEKKRLAYGITNHYFRFQALFDRVFLFQVHEGDGKTYGTGVIEMPDDQRDWEKERAPRGILISAGLVALDNLRSHGVDLGHTVSMNKLTPYHFRVGNVGGHDLYCLVARDGDLVGSMEAATDLRERRCAVVQNVHTDLETGLSSYQHVLKGVDGKLWAPANPWISDDQ